MDRVLAAPRGRKKHIIVGVAVITAVCIAIVLLRHVSDRVLALDRGRISTAVVSQAVFRDFLPLRGRVVPRDTVYIDAASGGRVLHVFVEPGDVVTAGQKLIEFNNTTLQLQVIQQESQLNQAITQLQGNEITLEQNNISNSRALAQLKFQIIRDTRLLNRRVALKSQGYVAAEEKELLEEQLNYEQETQALQEASNKRQEEIRLQQLPLIQEQLRELRKNLEIVRGKLDELTVVTPVDGKVTDIDLKVGENRNPGDRLATVTPATRIKVSADLDEYYLSHVHNGLIADIDLNGTTRELRVTRVYPEVKDGTFTVDLEFSGETPPDLLPGQAILGRLSLGADVPALVLKSGSFLEQNDGSVFVVSVDGTFATRRRVRIGRRTSEQVEILSGLRPDEVVVISDYRGLERIDRIDIH